MNGTTQLPFSLNKRKSKPITSKTKDDTREKIPTDKKLGDNQHCVRMAKTHYDPLSFANPCLFALAIVPFNRLFHLIQVLKHNLKYHQTIFSTYYKHNIPYYCEQLSVMHTHHMKNSEDLFQKLQFKLRWEYTFGKTNPRRKNKSSYKPKNIEECVNPNCNLSIKEDR